MDPTKITLSLLRQLAPKSLQLARLIWDRFASKGKLASQVEFRELRSILLSGLKDFTRLSFVIDALDEYPGGEDDFLARFRPLFRHEKANMFVTSRPLFAHQVLGHDVVRIEVHRPRDDGIDLSIHHLFQQHHLFRTDQIDERTQEKITKMISERVNGRCVDFVRL